ncbi:hypothetical protein OK351_08220 [Glutamicibacter sp. MNS18]|uniref:hypothetical protein n=1 Tax=Glutamicibacter sp. MNS18 TaxID=2989817 RepID=UPI002235E6BE|nr:hypothetical protein [Glutamicibacter sp. MNS18]MCW4465486.1 hypothetical protein [Glutamicibacter sp. MNS18]
MRKTQGNAQEILCHRALLNLGAVMGTACLVFAAIGLAFGIKPLVFVSGSMEPGIPPGSLGIAVSTPAEEVLVGQIVSVKREDGERVTHRVLSNSTSGLVLKGDANPVADLQPYEVQAVDRLLFSFPLLGKIVIWLSHPWIYFAGGMLSAYLLYIAFLRRAGDERVDSMPEANKDVHSFQSSSSTRIEKSSARRSRMTSGMALLVVFSATLNLSTLVVPFEPTHAAFNAQAEANAGFQAVELLGPESVACARLPGDAQTVEIGWMPPREIPQEVSGYRVTVSIDGNSRSEVVDRDVLIHTLSMRTSNSGLLNAVLGLVGALVNLLVGYSHTADVSIVALYSSGWESKPVPYKIHANYPGLLVSGSRQITCVG